MRRFIGTALALGLVAAITWQVSAAQTGGNPVVLCTRAGADVRSPASNGTCPSGYAKTSVSGGFERKPGGLLIISYTVTNNVFLTGDFTFQLIAAAPDGTTQTQIVTPVNNQSELGSFTYNDPLVGTYSFGIRMVGPTQEPQGFDTVPMQFTTQRDGEPWLTLDQEEMPTATTGGDLLHTVPFVYTFAPEVRPPT